MKLGSAENYRHRLVGTTLNLRVIRVQMLGQAVTLN
jgi:hypothetical protein